MSANEVRDTPRCKNTRSAASSSAVRVARASSLVRRAMAGGAIKQCLRDNAEPLLQFYITYIQECMYNLQLLPVEPPVHPSPCFVSATGLSGWRVCLPFS